MAATREEISAWLDEMYDNERYSHMFVVCDQFDWDDYPVFIKAGLDVREMFDDYNNKDMQKVMEVYSRNKTKYEQLMEERVMNFD